MENTQQTTFDNEITQGRYGRQAPVQQAGSSITVVGGAVTARLPQFHNQHDVAQLSDEGTEYDSTQLLGDEA